MDPRVRQISWFLLLHYGHSKYGKCKNTHICIWYLVDKTFFVHVLRNDQKIMFPSYSDQTADWTPQIRWFSCVLSLQNGQGDKEYTVYIPPEWLRRSGGSAIVTYVFIQCLLCLLLYIHFYIFANHLIRFRKNVKLFVEATALDRWGFAWERWLMAPQIQYPWGKTIRTPQ